MELTPLEFFEIVVESSRYFITDAHIQQQEELEGAPLYLPTTAPAVLKMEDSFILEVSKEEEVTAENVNGKMVSISIWVLNQLGACFTFSRHIYHLFTSANVQVSLLSRTLGSDLLKI